MKTPEPWVSLEAIANHLDVSVDTIYRWLADAHKGMPAVKVGRRWKFKISEVDVWIRSGQGGDTESDGKGKEKDSEEST